METTNTLITQIKKMALPGEVQQITGTSLLVKNLFLFLCNQSDCPIDLILLCRKDGMILSCRYATPGDDLSGHTLDLDRLKDAEDLQLFKVSDDYIIAEVCPREKSAVLSDLQKDFQTLLGIIEQDETSSRHLLHCLNSVKNAISIYDENATLLYANTSFCKDLSIPNLEDALGRNINDVIRDIGAKIHSMEDNSSSLKMMDVLKNGEEVIDWEIRIESTEGQKESKLVSSCGTRSWPKSAASMIAKKLPPKQISNFTVRPSDGRWRSRPRAYTKEGTFCSVALTASPCTTSTLSVTRPAGVSSFT